MSSTAACETCDLGHRARPPARLGSGAVRVDQGARAHRARPLRPRRRRARRGGDRRRAPVRPGEPGVRARAATSPRSRRGSRRPLLRSTRCSGASSLSRMWMQQGMLTVATSLRAHGATAVAEATAEIDAIAEANGIRPTALGARRSRARRGPRVRSREELERLVGPLTANELRRDLTHALELLARALSDLGQWDDALDVCDRGLALCEDTGAVPMTWRLRGCQGLHARPARAERRGGRRPSPRRRRLRYTRPSDPRPRAASLVQPPAARRTLAG